MYYLCLVIYSNADLGHGHIQFAMMKMTMMMAMMRIMLMLMLIVIMMIESRLRQTANVRFKLRISQNLKEKMSR